MRLTGIEQGSGLVDQRLDQPMAGAKRFCDRMRTAGNVCELHVYEGFGHLFTPAGTPDDGMPKPDQATSEDAFQRACRFLESIKVLK